MPIEFRCLSCQHMLRTPDESAGKKARCPGCGGIQTVPNPPAVDHTLTPQQTHTPQQAHAPQQTHAASSTTPPVWSSPSQSPGANPFADAPVANPYPSAPAQMMPLTVEQVRVRLLPPALVLLVMHCLGLLLAVLVLIAGVIEESNDGFDAEDSFGFVIVAIGVVVMLVSIPGCIAMISRRFHWLALTTMILSVLVSFLCLMLPLLPFGIWGIIVLANPQVKAHFR